MSVEKAATDDAPKTLKEAAALLDQVPASAILPILRQPDFMMVAGVAFQGFRTDASGYANAVVRRRLAEEVVSNEKFAAKLIAFVRRPPGSAPATAPKAVPRPVVPVSGPAAEDRAMEKYKAERDRLKLERDAAVAAQKDAERQYTEARAKWLAAENAQAEAARESDKTKQKLERAERKVRQLEIANAELRRGAVHGPSDAPRRAANAPEITLPPVSSPVAPASSAFADAVRHLLGKQKAPIALSLTEDVLRASPDDPDALDIQAEALIALNRDKEALAPLRHLVTVLLQRNDAARAADALARLLARSNNLLSETKAIRDFYTALGRLPESIPAASRTFERLSHTMPPAYDALRAAAPRDLSERLFGDPSRTPTPEMPLPIALGPKIGLTVSARQIVAAINRNQEDLIDAIRNVLPSLDDATRATIKMAVLAAADGDESYYKLLVSTEKRRGPVVVDASNIAWHGQEMLASAKPRLEYVLSVRKALRERGYFPIRIIADANLPFVVNDTPAARRLVADEEIILVNGGSDADEALVREAKRLRAPLITNDYMTDWDAQRLVTKVQYVISLTDGRATLYF